MAFPVVEVGDPSASFCFELLDIAFQPDQALPNRLDRQLIEILGFEVSDCQSKSISLSHTRTCTTRVGQETAKSD